MSTINETFDSSIFKYFPTDNESTDVDACGFYFSNSQRGYEAMQYLLINSDNGLLRAVFQIQQENRISITLTKMDHSLIIALNNIESDASSIQSIIKKSINTPYFSCALVHLSLPDKQQIFQLSQQFAVLTIKSVHLI